eukprot:COSAG05_NODE_188_length_14697_cov_11.861145_10_plen_46_part_00
MMMMMMMVMMMVVMMMMMVMMTMSHMNQHIAKVTDCTRDGLHGSG